MSAFGGSGIAPPPSFSSNSSFGVLQPQQQQTQGMGMGMGGSAFRASENMGNAGQAAPKNGLDAYESLL